jgi:hypothetical protein
MSGSPNILRKKVPATKIGAFLPVWFAHDAICQHTTNFATMAKHNDIPAAKSASLTAKMITISQAPHSMVIHRFNKFLIISPLSSMMFVFVDVFSKIAA